MKTLLSLLCTIAIVVAQCVSTAAAATIFPAQDAPCRCCDCGQRGCCAAEQAPDGAPGPAVPATALRHSDVQCLSVEWVRVPVLSFPAPSLVSVAFLDARSVTAVPLFARDCARLL